jgi:hypothetical protein
VRKLSIAVLLVLMGVYLLVGKSAELTLAESVAKRHEQRRVAIEEATGDSTPVDRDIK